MNTKIKMGRPKLPKDEARRKFVSTRVSTPEYMKILTAIKKSGLRKPDWARNALITAAR
jgi:hypothetical protein